ncbi:EAL domain-containing protein [Undibacterium sp.]|uniref:putative bifunctional diguanylate cyclase/phosphodiesterase n=1 Tax=Undibacterium sp. TaxID=1914977 RepID=UPI0025EBDE0E|nr:EAL domain-containing protein [Undibacterium sp.]
MILSSDMPNISLGVALSEAIFGLQTPELELELDRIVKLIFGHSYVSFVPQEIDKQQSLRNSSVCASAENYYVLSGKKGAYSEADIATLGVLTQLTARLFAAKLQLDDRYHQSSQAQLMQAQILDQIHESVITMDLAGFVLSWNKGAERLFGYTAAEATGQNILFLYDDEDDECEGFPASDVFLESGGREMEVRRRKKNGDIFWASLSLSTLRGQDGAAIGMIGYLRDITGRKQAEEKINYLAYYDLLTALPNRTHFKKLVDKALQQSQRKGAHSSILFVDLNRFKLINDTLGHQIGDLLLTQVAQRFIGVLRENDVVARLGSDEFGIALIDVSQDFHAALVSQKILSCLDLPFHVSGHELRVAASIGISVYPQDGVDATQLLQKADIAMFKAKRIDSNASGSYVFYDNEMDQHIAGRLYLESGMLRALHLNEFFLLYQPKIEIASGRIIAAEALIRWAHPTKGTISPLEFIPIAEETGLILQIDSWVLDTACAQARLWQDAGILPFRIAVNVSAREFSADLPDRITQALQAHEISAAWLELEITESMLMRNTESVIKIMGQITALGVSLSLDDFGTGYSSLSYLKRFPIETLKIDRSFIRGIPEDQDDCAIAGAIISMAKQLKHKVIAEGVENHQQLDFLKKVGCDEIQGYLFSHPVDADEFKQLLSRDFRVRFE